MALFRGLSESGIYPFCYLFRYICFSIEEPVYTGSIWIFSNLNQCMPSWPGGFQFCSFLNDALSGSGSISASGPPSIKPCNFFRNYYHYYYYYKHFTEKYFTLLLSLFLHFILQQRKCDQYWPDEGSQVAAGITIECLGVDKLPDFTIRTFLLQLVSNFYPVNKRKKRKKRIY